ncbi:MAG TPA: FkbM family methyltransferase [Opitutaceae bacterium]|nr:FkbM family methyltransferase [Opitutaceae bacterium]
MNGRLPFGFSAGRLLMRVRPAPLASLVKRLLRIRRCEITTREGTFWVDPASYAGLELAGTGVYDPATLAAIRRLVRPGDTFVDIGANEGYFTVVASGLVGPAGRVLAVEPQLRLEPVLSRNLSLNGCSNVVVVQAAISDHSGTAVLHLTPDMNNAASGLEAPTRYVLAKQSTPLMTLAELLARAPGAAPVVKMDIESFEHEAIHGGEALFRAGAVRALILELHRDMLLRRRLDAGAVPRLLRDCGYEQAADCNGLVWARPVRLPGGNP